MISHPIMYVCHPTCMDIWTSVDFNDRYSRRTRHHILGVSSVICHIPNFLKRGKDVNVLRPGLPPSILIVSGRNLESYRPSLSPKYAAMVQPTGTSSLAREEPRVVVGLDFGTTFSGFSYALKSDPEQIYLFYEWPGAQEASNSAYCKTSTSLRYTSDSDTGKWSLENWGWRAVIDSSNVLERSDSPPTLMPNAIGQCSQRLFNTGESHRDDVSMIDAASGRLVSLFKLHLADKDATGLGNPLPPGMILHDVITDFLRKISAFILTDVRHRFGGHLSMADIQWVLTVPIIWGERSKQRMKLCAELAGMVEGSPESSTAHNGGSRHELVLVLEPEAASIYCQSLPTWNLSVGERFVVVDAGGGTVDLVGQEVVDGNATREVSISTGGLCGGKFVDDNFYDHVADCIGGFAEFAAMKPASVMGVMRQWQKEKRTFRGSGDGSFVLAVPVSLATAWETYNAERGLPVIDTDELVVSSSDICRIFEPVVAEILDLVHSQIEAVDGCQAILLVGGFSDSPYLQSRIRDAFPELRVIIPPNPGAAICQGATLFALHPQPIQSRVARRFYGIAITRPFQQSDPPSKKLVLNVPTGTFALCDDVFLPFVEIGDEVGANACVEHVMFPCYAQQTEALVELYSSKMQLQFTTDAGVVKEGSFLFPMEDTSKGLDRKLAVSMYFGRAYVELRARGVNFGSDEVDEGILLPAIFMEGNE